MQVKAKSIWFCFFYTLERSWSYISAGNKNLTDAKKAKNDEFYTQRTDIEAELLNYEKHFRNKIVYCNCNDGEKSEFWKFFIRVFQQWGLKKLIAVHYEPNKDNFSYKVEATPVQNGQILIIKSFLLSNGDFRSQACIELLKKVDIVVTNPPFSLFREYIAQLMKYEKKFVIIGNVNAVIYKEFFPLIKDNKVWIGPSIHSGDREFRVPSNYPLHAVGWRIDENGNKYIRVKGVRWFTNLDIKKRHVPIDLRGNYYKDHEDEYPKYDNYDAINVDKVADIPIDYDGVMGVPITFIDKYCPEQFEILGMTSGRNEFDKVAWPIKRYKNARQHNKDGSVVNGSKANTGAAILLNCDPINKIYYTADNANGSLKIEYARILIKNKSFFKKAR